MNIRMNQDEAKIVMAGLAILDDSPKTKRTSEAVTSLYGKMEEVFSCLNPIQRMNPPAVDYTDMTHCQKLRADINRIVQDAEIEHPIR